MTVYTDVHLREALHRAYGSTPGLRQELRLHPKGGETIERLLEAVSGLELLVGAPRAAAIVLSLGGALGYGEQHS